jgi:parvulin-like peptidyl-prolyl isomerase
LAKKHGKSEIQRPFTKHQQSRWERQKRRQRIITIVGVTFFVVIFGFIGLGYYNAQIKPFNQKVLKVNDATISMDYYLKALEIFSQGRETSSSMITVMANMTLDAIEQNELVKQAAPKLGISVSDQEVDDMFKITGLPDGTVVRDIIGAELLGKKMTDDYFDKRVPTITEQAQVQAMFLESKDVAQEVLTRLATGDNFTALAGELSLESVTKGKSGDLGWLPKGQSGLLLWKNDNPLFEQIVFSLEPGKISEPTYDPSVTKQIGYWLVEVIEKNDAQGVHARGILLGSRQEAEEIRAKLQAGENFADLAQKYSLHQESKDKGGDLGWLRWFEKGQGLGKDVLIEIAYQLEPGIVGDPYPDTSVQTQGGYWLIKVLNKDDNRKIDDDVREQMKAKAFQDWLDEQRGNSHIEKYLTNEQKNWAVARVIKLQNAKSQASTQR